jgi:hypothetical protein
MVWRDFTFDDSLSMFHHESFFDSSIIDHIHSYRMIGTFNYKTNHRFFYLF